MPSDVHAQHLAAAIGADRDDDGDVDDAAVVADLHVGCVDPQIRPVASMQLDRPGAGLLIAVAIAVAFAQDG